jgi:hypothetical protein
MQIKSTFAIAVVLGATAGLTGCTETLDSQNIKTAGISATIEATAPSETESTVHVTLKAGGDESNTYIDLGGGDRIFATVGGERKEMSSVSSGEYEAESTKGAADTEFKISLERADGDNAPDSIGTLPAPFDLTAVSGTVSRATDLEIAWSPAADDGMEIELDGTCIFNEKIDVASNATSHTVPANSLDSTGPSDMPATCDLTVTVRRSRVGTADRALDAESSFLLEQVRSMKVTSSP